MSDTNTDIDAQTINNAYEMYTIEYIAQKEAENNYYIHMATTALLGGGLFYLLYKFNSDNIAESSRFFSGNY
jgi:hypothetical protein